MDDSDATSSAPADILDPDGIYRQIGVYVVSFQHLENQLFQLCWFLTEPAYSETGRSALAEKTYSWLVGEAGRRVFSFLCSKAERSRTLRSAFTRTCTNAARSDAIATASSTLPTSTWRPVATFAASFALT
jgi:hypothetical protein